MHDRDYQQPDSEMLNCSICCRPVEVFYNGYEQTMDGEITCDFCMSLNHDEYDYDDVDEY